MWWINRAAGAVNLILIGDGVAGAYAILQLNSHPRKKIVFPCVSI